MAEKARFVIPKTGLATGKSQVRAIYSEQSCEILEAVGKTETQRASHVEPGSELSQDALVLIYPAYSQKIHGIRGNKLQIQPVWATHWFADMTPTGHDRVLGPFPPSQRDAALAAEVEWLKEHNLPVCAPCIEKQHQCCNPDTAEDAGESDLRGLFPRLISGLRKVFSTR